MKNVRLDKNGIPVLNRLEIEVRTERFLGAFNEACLTEPRSTPISEIAMQLQSRFGACFRFRQDLGNRRGRKVRGTFHIPSKTIYIDKSLPEGEPRFNFTLAHEIGHFVMHQKIKPQVLKDTGTYESIEDDDRDLLLDQLNTDNPRTWLEWQANKFASSLMLPRYTVPIAIIEKQKELGVTRNLGRVLLDRQSGNVKDYYEILDHLVLIYQVSKAAIRIRLRELNILTETSLGTGSMAHGPEHIGIKMANAIDELFAKYDE